MVLEEELGDMTVAEDESRARAFAANSNNQSFQSLKKKIRKINTTLKKSSAMVSMKSLASLKVIRAAFSKRYPALRFYADYVFTLYGTETPEFLSKDDMGQMLQDFHKEFGVLVGRDEESLLAEALMRLCIREHYNSSTQGYTTRCGIDGLCKECFIEILQTRLGASDLSADEHGMESENDFGGTQRHHKRRSIIQWTSIALLQLIFTAFIVWVIMSPDYKNTLLWSLFSEEIIVARIGAGLALSGTFFALLFVNTYFVRFLLEKMYKNFHVHMSMITLHKFFAATILLGGFMHMVAWLVLYSKMVRMQRTTENGTCVSDAVNEFFCRYESFSVLHTG